MISEQRAAYHEAGHAVADHCLNADAPMQLRLFDNQVARLLEQKAHLERLADRACRRYGPLVLYGLLNDLEGVEDDLARATGDATWIEGAPMDPSELEELDAVLAGGAQ